MQQPEYKTLAQEAYEAWKDNFEAIRLMNDNELHRMRTPLLTWAALPNAEKAAWGAAARTVQSLVKKRIKDLITYAE